MIYCFICDECDLPLEVVRAMSESGDPQACPNCGTVMRRDYPAENTHGRGDYSQPLVMRSLGFHPSQLAEHRKHFPNIEVTTVPGGMMAPVARSLAEKRRVLKDRGWTDRNAFY